MDSSRAVLAAAFWRWFSANTAEKSRSVAVVVRALSPCIARSCSASRSVSPCNTGVIALTTSSAVGPWGFCGRLLRTSKMASSTSPTSASTRTK